MAIVDGKILCPECSTSKELAAFESRDIERGNGYCKPCKRKRTKAWIKANSAHDLARRRELYAARKSPEALAELQRRRAHAALAADDVRRGRKAASARYRLKNLYGIGEVGYDRLAAEQGNRCACCGATENVDGRLWCVDHDHDTGVIRGLLCVRCNVGIGALGDSVAGLRRALAYLERTQSEPAANAPPTMRINLLRGVN